MSTLTEKLCKIKDGFLNMDLTNKRQLYACKDSFVTLSMILPWSQYVKKNNVTSSLSEEEDEKAFSVDEDINSKVSLWQGDITTLEVDVIVNAANTTLLGGGGVDGAIHEAAGDDLLEECKTLNGCETGSAKITGGYKLPAKYVIHAVGPHDQNSKLLKQVYQKSLELMMQNNLKSIAFPSISTGVFGYRIKDASHVALLAVRNFLSQNKDEVDRVIFTVFSETDKAVYEDHMLRYFPVNKDNSTNKETTDTNQKTNAKMGTD